MLASYGWPRCIFRTRHDTIGSFCWRPTTWHEKALVMLCDSFWPFVFCIIGDLAFVLGPNRSGPIKIFFCVSFALRLLQIYGRATLSSSVLHLFKKCIVNCYHYYLRQLFICAVILFPCHLVLQGLVANHQCSEYNQHSNLMVFTVFNRTIYLSKARENYLHWKVRYNLNVWHWPLLQMTLKCN